MKKQQKPHLSNNILCNLSAGARSSSIIRFYCDPRTKSDSNTQPVKKQQITEQPNDRTPRNDGSSLATHRIERRISSGTQGLICTNYRHHVGTGWIFLTFFFGVPSQVLRLKPPMCITQEDARFAVAVLRKSFQRHAEGVRVWLGIHRKFGGIFC